TPARTTAPSASSRRSTPGPCWTWAASSRRPPTNTEASGSRSRPRSAARLLQGMSPSTILSRADLDFLLHDWPRATELPERERDADHSRETTDAAIDLAAA